MTESKNMESNDSETLDSPFGNYTLQRIPDTQKGGLRAWDSADELLLQTLFTEHKQLLENAIDASNPILIINDTFGALTVALNTCSVDSWSDSYLSHLATQKNIGINNLKAKPTFILATQLLTNDYALVILKIPKTLALLEDQLYRLKPHISAKSIIIASAMSKHIHTSTLKLFEKIIGTTTTSRATKKARLLFCKNDNTDKQVSPYPKTIIVPEFDLKLLNHANVFSQNHLDIGTRFFLEHLKDCPQAQHIIDLGCGNGALGIIAQRLQPDASLSFIDESYMAVDSAKQSYLLNGYKQQANFVVSNGFDLYSLLDQQAPLKQDQINKADLILCNPPFHQAHSMGDHTAWQMFKQSMQHLNFKGELWVIGNRHLAYHIKLKKLFGNCRTIASNKKFVLLASHKR